MISRETLFPKPTSGGGSNIVPWNLQTSVVPEPPKLTVVPDGELPIPLVASVLTDSTISYSNINNSFPSYSLAKISDNVNFGSSKWMLGRINSVSGTFLAGVDFIGFGIMSFEGTPAGAFVGYSILNQALEIRDAATSTLLQSTPANVNDWFAIYVNNTTNTIGVIAQSGANISTVVTAVPDISALRVYAGATLMVPSGTGSYELEISIDENNLGNIDVTGMQPIAVNVTVLPQNSTVGDILKVTASGVYKNVNYYVNDLIVYAQQTPELLVSIPQNILSTSKSVRVPEDFANINLALAEARKYVATSTSYTKSQFIITISEGHTLVEADKVSIIGEKLPHVYIVAEGNGVNVDNAGGGGVFFSLFNCSFGGIKGVFTEVSDSSVSLVYASSVIFTSGLGALGAPLVTNNFRLGENFTDCEIPICYITSNSNPLNTSSDFGWSGNKLYISSIKTDRNLNLGSNETNSQSIYSTKKEGQLYIKHQFNGSGAFNIYFENDGSVAPNDFTVLVFGKTSGTITSESFSIAFRESPDNVSLPHLSRVISGYSNLIVDIATNQNMNWKSDGNPLVTMDYPGVTCVVDGIFPAQIHPTSSVPANIAIISPMCQLHMTEWNSVIRGTHYTSSFGKLRATSNVKKRLPYGVSAYGSFINVFGTFSVHQDDEIFVGNVTTLNITEEHAGKTVYVNCNIDNVNVVFNTSPVLADNSAFEPGFVKIVKLGTANEITFTGVANSLVLDVEYSSVVFKVDHAVTNGRWIGSYSIMPTPIV